MANTRRLDRRGAVRPQMVAILVLIALVAGFYWMRVSSLESQERQKSLDRTLSNFLSNLTPAAQLDSLYEDNDGDLLPDAPENDALIAAPTELHFSFIATSGDTNSAEVWKPVLEALESNTGIPTKYTRFESTKKQLQALRSGTLHITTLSTGEVPTAVNTCGFIPVCTTGREDGSFSSTMQFLVAADSKIQNLSDLKGKKVAFTRPKSNSGYKAAMLELLLSHKMLPERDYQWSFTNAYLDSMKAVASGKADAAPVASDLFAREIEKGTIKKEDFKVIYESERFPPMAFGFAYNLAPEFRDQIRTAFLELEWQGTPLPEQLGGDGSTQFVEVSYKDDWANIRRIDQAAIDFKKEIEGN